MKQILEIAVSLSVGDILIRLSPTLHRMRNVMWVWVCEVHKTEGSHSIPYSFISSPFRVRVGGSGVGVTLLCLVIKPRMFRGASFL